nr:HAD hydrolase-like protein [Stappia taiwanensis]
MTVVPTSLPTTRRRARLDPRDVKQARIVLCDLDGCLMSEGRLFEETAAFADGCGDRLRIVSNRSDSTAEALASQLSGLGLSVPPAHILMAGEFTLQHLARQGVRRLTLCAAPLLMARARALGLDPEARDPQAVLLCRDPAQTVDTLGPLLAPVARGVPLWVSNEDVSHPDHAGRPVAETGALLAALRAIRPGLAWHCLGKPHAAMLLHAMAEAGLEPAQSVFVGDNAATDGRAAEAAGMSFIHIQRRAGK